MTASPWNRSGCNRSGCNRSGCYRSLAVIVLAVTVLTVTALAVTVPTVTVLTVTVLTPGSECNPNRRRGAGLLGAQGVPPLRRGAVERVPVRVRVVRGRRVRRRL
jgi:hypothetical protein